MPMLMIPKGVITKRTGSHFGLMSSHNLWRIALPPESFSDPDVGLLLGGGGGKAGAIPLKTEELL